MATHSFTHIVPPVRFLNLREAKEARDKKQILVTLRFSVYSGKPYNDASGRAIYQFISNGCRIIVSQGLPTAAIFRGAHEMLLRDEATYWGVSASS